MSQISVSTARCSETGCGSRAMSPSCPSVKRLTKRHRLRFISFQKPKPKFLLLVQRFKVQRFSSHNKPSLHAQEVPHEPSNFSPSSQAVLYPAGAAVHDERAKAYAAMRAGQKVQLSKEVWQNMDKSAPIPKLRLGSEIEAEKRAARSGTNRSSPQTSKAQAQSGRSALPTEAEMGDFGNDADAELRRQYFSQLSGPPPEDDEDENSIHNFRTKPEDEPLGIVSMSPEAQTKRTPGLSKHLTSCGPICMSQNMLL